jgi:hypothetical protein
VSALFSAADWCAVNEIGGDFGAKNADFKGENGDFGGKIDFSRFMGPDGCVIFNFYFIYLFIYYYYYFAILCHFDRISTEFRLIFTDFHRFLLILTDFN